tara:strand:- start:53350 stop:53490 length:141 start_codon:yes stop_codon:yes gene_type:complete
MNDLTLEELQRLIEWADMYYCEGQMEDKDKLLEIKIQTEIARREEK